jgi:hypothetical protein
MQPHNENVPHRRRGKPYVRRMSFGTLFAAIRSRTVLWKSHKSDRPQETDRGSPAARRHQRRMREREEQPPQLVDTMRRPVFQRSIVGVMRLRHETGRA